MNVPRLHSRRTLGIPLVGASTIILALTVGSAANPAEGDSVAALEAAGGGRKPNVLFIAVDDLNHWVRHLGRNPQAKTPNIDRLAARGVTFTRAYCAAPLCNPSRAALMSGLRPSTTGVYLNSTDWRPLIPEERTLPSHFRGHGYRVAGAGKIYHGGFDRRSEWDDYYKFAGAGGRGVDGPLKRGGAGGINFAELDGDDDVLADHHVVSWTIGELGKERDRPFFLACGIFRPHLPWNVPKKYFDLYDLEDIRLPPVKESDLDDVPPAGVRMANPGGDHAAITGAGIWKECVRAYLASISFADAQVGRLIDALDASPHRDDTIIVLWGDHGWHLGEKLHWRKFSLWEEATRAPLIWVVPGTTKPGGVCDRTVDFMSIYPTLSDLCGLPVPGHVEGPSIRRLLADPKAEWSTPALTTYGFRNHAVRTERWRYIRYADGSEELYDAIADPLEWTNLAGREDLAGVKAELARGFPSVERAPPRAGGGRSEGRPRAGAKAPARKEARPEG